MSVSITMVELNLHFKRKKMLQFYCHLYFVFQPDFLKRTTVQRHSNIKIHLYLQLIYLAHSNLLIVEVKKYT